MIVFNTYTLLIGISIVNFVSTAYFTQVIKKGKSNLANNCLTGFCIVISLTELRDVLFVNQVYDQHPALIFLDQFPLLLVGPMMYFYIRYLTDNNPAFKWSYLLHGTTVFIYMIAVLPLKLQPLSVQLAVFHKIMQGIIPMPFMYDNFIKLQVFFYLCLTYLRVRKHKRVIKNLLSTTEDYDLKWINQLILFFFIIFIIWFLGDNNLMDDNSLGITMMVFSYWLGYHVIRQKSIYEHLAPGFKIESVENFSDNVKYKNSRLNADEKLKYVNRISECMQGEKPYLENELTLTMLADKLNMKPNFLSQILNEGFGENFYSFINRHRIEESKHLLRDKKYSNYNIQGIAFEAGFNSKSTFNKSFKELVGVSPSDYQKQQQGV